MKSKITKLFIGLSLGISTLAGCSLFNPKRNSSANGQNDFGVGEEVQPFAGDNSKSIDKIPNTPVQEYNANTLKRIRDCTEKMYGSYNEDFYNGMVDSMLAFGIGDNLAIAVCDFVDNAYSLGPNYSNDKYFTELSNYYYDALKILNSVDFNNAANFLTKINEIYNNSRNSDRQDNRYSSILDYYQPELGYRYLSYRDYKIMKEANVNNAQFNTILNAYDNVYQNYHFTDEQYADYERYVQQSSSSSSYDDDYVLIPTSIISFVRKHAGSAQETIIQKLKLIVDASLEASSLYDELIKQTTRGGYDNSLVLRTTYGNSYYYDNNDNYGISSVSFIAKVLEKRSLILGLCKAILADEKIGDLAVSAAKEFIIPMLKESYPENDQNNAVFTRLTNKLNSLNGKHVSALVTFVLNLINEIHDEDVLAFVNYAHGNGNFDINSFGDKYIGKLDSAIASLSSSDKALITEIMNILGINVFDEIASFTKIFKEKNLSNEAGQERYYDALNTWFNSLSQKMQNELGLSYEEGQSYSGGGNHYEEPEIRNYPYVTVNFDELHLGATLEEAQQNLRVEYYYRIYDDRYGYEYENYFSDYYFNWNNNLQYYRDELENAEQNPDYYSEREIEELRMRSELEISGLSIINFDTSRCGYASFKVSFTLGGQYYEVETTATIQPGNDVPKLYVMESSNSSSSYNAYFNNRWFENVYDINSNVSVSGYDKSITLDTSREGWNVYLEEVSNNNEYYYYDFQYFICLYYVVNESNLAQYKVSENESIGFYLEGKTNFTNEPYYNVRYKIGNLELSKHHYLPFEQSYASGKAANQEYTVNYEGHNFKYVILSKSNSTVLAYRFYLDEYITSEIRQPTTKTATVEVDCMYTATINGVTYGISSYDSLGTKTLSNFTYVNGIVSFQYENQSFSFEVGSIYF